MLPPSRLPQTTDGLDGAAGGVADDAEAGAHVAERAGTEHVDEDARGQVARSDERRALLRGVGGCGGGDGSCCQGGRCGDRDRGPEGLARTD